MSTSPIEMPGRSVPVLALSEVLSPDAVLPLSEAVVEAPVVSEEQRAYVGALRALAEFLEGNPGLPVPSGQFLTVPVGTVRAVEEFAAGRGLSVEYDDEGNAHSDLPFGPLTYHVYGYRDFAEHVARVRERDARRWVESQGMVLRPAESGEGA